MDSDHFINTNLSKLEHFVITITIMILGLILEMDHIQIVDF